MTEMTPLPYCAIEATVEGKRTVYVTLSSPSSAFEHGVATSQILGQLLNPSENLTPSNFARNPEFMRRLQEVMANLGPSLPGITIEAKRQVSGLVVVFDGRTRDPQGAVPPEDIVGAFKVADGLVEPASYIPNPNYRLFTAAGFPCLDRRVVEALTTLQRAGCAGR